MLHVNQPWVSGDGQNIHIWIIKIMYLIKRRDNIFCLLKVVICASVKNVREFRNDRNNTNMSLPFILHLTIKLFINI